MTSINTRKKKEKNMKIIKKYFLHTKCKLKPFAFYKIQQQKKKNSQRKLRKSVNNKNVKVFLPIAHSVFFFPNDKIIIIPWKKHTKIGIIVFVTKKRKLDKQKDEGKMFISKTCCRQK